MKRLATPRILELRILVGLALAMLAGVPAFAQPALVATLDDELWLDADGDAAVGPGDTVRYTVAISNPPMGPDPVTGIVFTSGTHGCVGTAGTCATLVAGSVTTTQGTVTTGNANGDTSAVVALGALADTEGATVTYQVVITSPLPPGTTGLTTQATVSSSSPNVPSDDPDTGTAGDATATSLVSPSLAVSLVEGADPTTPGSTVSYTATITNSGTGPATDVEFRVTMGAGGSELGNVTTSQGSVLAGNGMNDIEAVVAVGDLATSGPGATATVGFDIVVSIPVSTGLTSLEHQATISASNHSSVSSDDPNLPGSEDATITAITAAPSLSASLVGAVEPDDDIPPFGLANPGDTLLYTVTITNSGDQDADGVLYESSLTDGNLSLVVGSVVPPPGGSVELGNLPGESTVRVAVGTLPGDDGVVEPGGNEPHIAEVQYEVTVGAPIGIDAVTEQGSISGTGIAATPTNIDTTDLFSPAGAWSTVGTLIRDSSAHTATLLLDGRVLITGGRIGGAPEETAHCEIFDPGSGSSRQVTDLPVTNGLADHAATLLESGNVLVVGSQSSSVQALVFDTDGETWNTVDQLAGARAALGDPGIQATLTRLADGTVLLVGASGTFLFDEGAGTWSATTGSMGTDRTGHTATLLPDGDVLIAGGRDTSDSVLSSYEIYDPGTQTFTTGAMTMGSPRADHRATLLLTGEVVAVGGVDDVDTALATSEIFRTSPEGWSVIADPLGAAQSDLALAQLPSGLLLLAGGTDPERSEIFDPDLDPFTGTWDQGPGPSRSRLEPTLLTAPTGEVLLFGNSIYVESFREWDDAPDGSDVPDPDPLSSVAASLIPLPDGRVLRVGGPGSTPEIFDPSTDTWSDTGAIPGGTTLGDSPFGIVLSTATPQILILGWVPETPNAPTGGTEQTALVLHYDVDGDTWTELDAPMVDCGSGDVAVTLEIIGQGATLLPNGQVMFTHQEDVCGDLDGRTTFFLDVTDGTTYAWSTPSGTAFDEDRAAGLVRSRQTAITLLTGEVLVAGGLSSDDGPLPTVEIWDPETETWTYGPSLENPRSMASALLLPDGRVAVIGGIQADDSLAPPEIYDPATGTWTSGSVGKGQITPRGGERPALLPSGRLVWMEDSVAHLLDFQSLSWSSPLDVSALDDGVGYRSVLLPSGEVLAVERSDGATIRYAPEGQLHPLRPQLDSATASLQHAATAAMTGQRFGGQSEANGSGRGAGVHHPVVQLTALEGGRQVHLGADPLPTFCSSSAAFCGESIPSSGTLDVTEYPANLFPGWYQLRVQTAGRPSDAELVHFACSLAITAQPSLVASTNAMDPAPNPTNPDKVDIGNTATFTVEAAGAVGIQWQSCTAGTTACSTAADDPDWSNIDSATSETYTTPAISGPESGTLYRAVLTSLCLDTVTVSDPVALNVLDETPPTVTVESPRGGEYWLLSDDADSANWNQQTLTWSMSDDVRICQVDVTLLASTDGGTSFAAVSEALDDGLPESFGDGGVCVAPGESRTNMTYRVPNTPPSGSDGALYKLQVEVTDHAGNLTTATSENPFFIVDANPDSVKTLILHHVDRMETVQGITTTEAANLRSDLVILAENPRVQGVVVDLGLVTDVTDLYTEWDADPTDPDWANRVLFGCHDVGAGLPVGCPGELNGIHDTLRELLGIYTAVENLVLVGDDRILPMARMPDRGVLLQESTYAAGGDLSDANGESVVEVALAANKYLSDDPMATIDPIVPDDLSTDLFVPDLAAGRLVETVGEIRTTIATFISTSGVIDLADVAAGSNHQVLVAGYDFLQDTATVIRERWKGALGDAGGDTSLLPVNGFLISDDWGEANASDRKDLLFEHLDGFAASGSSGLPYAIHSFNGHANHYGEGLPGTDAFDIQGLDALDFVGAGSCSTSTIGGAAGLDLAGTFAYSIGCHGGLPVPGDCSTDDDHSLDLVQAMMRQGSLAYIANTGYGWGLVSGIGYAERLVQILTEELTSGVDYQVGAAIVASKQRYVLENVSFDGYDEKSLQQWTLFGLPMTKIVTGISARENQMARYATGEVIRERPFRGEAPKARELPRMERHGPVKVERRAIEGATADGLVARGATTRSLPQYLTRLELFFDFSAPGVYTKRNSNGVEIADTVGCPDVDGCYYTLNGLVERSSGATDLPIQPYFTFDSRLSGTSQHGVLWMGGTYEEEESWVPVTATLISNDAASVGDDHGSLPRTAGVRNIATRAASGENATCTAADLELNGLVIGAGEAVSIEGSFDHGRRYLDVDLETFYFNNTSDGSGNCDRDGPSFGSGPFSGDYHSADGPSIEWEVPVSDAETDVWRVVVVYTDNTVDDPDQDGRGTGTWTPLELTDQGDGTWVGTTAVTSSDLMTYVLQAVDLRGNVTMLDFTNTARTEASSGVDPDIPLTTDVTLAETATDLMVTTSDTPDPVSAGQALTYRLDVENLGSSTAFDVEATLDLPSTVSFSGLAAGSGWTCAEDTGLVTCTRSSLAPGAAPSVQVLTDTPLEDGTVIANATVSATGNNDPDTLNDLDSEATTVVFSAIADLQLGLTADRAWVPAGGQITYSLNVSNAGPGDVLSAVLVDVFPGSLDSIVWSCTPGIGADCPTSGNGNVIVSLGLDAGSSLTIDALAIVNAQAAGTITHTGSVAPPFGVHDPDTTNDVQTIVTPIGLFFDGFESGGTDAW